MPLSQRKTLRGAFCLGCLGVLLAGCAQFPSLDALTGLKPLSDYRAAQAFSAPAGEWPGERWWSGYGDRQLDTLIDEALRDSPDLAAAAARLRRAEAISQIAGAPLAPQISANAQFNEQKLSYNYLTPRQMTPQGWNDYGRITLDFGWELDFWGKNRAALAAAVSQLEAGRAEFAQVRLTLAAAVAMNYAELARLFAVRETLARSVEVRRQTVHLFHERFANGLENLGGLNEAKARQAGAEAELLAQEEQIALQRYRLAALLGAGPDRGLSIERPTVRLDGRFALPQTLAADLLGRRPDIVAARRMVEAQEQRIGQKKAEFYPNISLVGLLGVQSFGLNMLDKSGSSVGSIGPAISWPIFTGGRLQGELRASVANYDEAVANYHRALTQALQEVASTGLSQQALAEQLVKGREAVAAASEAHRVARNRYEGGLANHLEVPYAEDGLMNSQRQLALLQSRAFMLDVALKRALGGGYEQH